MVVHGAPRRPAGVLLSGHGRGHQWLDRDDRRGVAAAAVGPSTRCSGLLDAGATQCGFCTPGFVMAIVDLLERDPHPGTADIGEALAGNICRCTGYGSIVRAVRRLADDAGRR